MLFGFSHAPLVQLPERGAGILQTCTTCERQVWFGGLDLCRLFPAWLVRDVWLWALAMKCDDCPSPRQTFAARNDPSAGAFSLGSHDPVEAQRIRRLMAWLPEGGQRIDDVAYLIRDVDPRQLRAAGFDPDVVALFTSHAYGADHFHPSRQQRRSVVSSG